MVSIRNNVNVMRLLTQALVAQQNALIEGQTTQWPKEKKDERTNNVNDLHKHYTED
jgi:hypothetical protein